MEKLILTSVMLATFAIPAVLLRRDPDGDGRDDYRKVLKPFACFVAFYAFLLLYVYPRVL